MSFTDRFIKLPIRVFDTKHRDLTGEEVLEESWMKINPMEISNYKPSYVDDERTEQGTWVALKNSDSFFVYLLPEDFEKSLNDHLK